MIRRIAPIALIAALAACAPASPAGTVPKPQAGAAATHPSASLTATPTPASPTLAPSSSGATQPQETGLKADTVARVVTNDLVVRSAPGVGGSSEILPERLDAMVESLPPEPQLLYVVDGPVTADGYDWYLVKAFLPGYCADVCPEPPFGWVAAGSGDGEAWIEPHTLDCPEPTVENLMWLSGLAQLACFDGQTLVLDGEAGDCFVAERPEASFQQACYLHPPDFVEPGGINPRFIGVVTALVEWPQDGWRVKVTGRFDHPAAVQCQGMSEETAHEFGIDPATLPPPALASLTCRTAFFATSVETASR
jgi:hypothetical protein